MSVARTGVIPFDNAVANAEAVRQVAVQAAAGNQVLIMLAEVVFYTTVQALGFQYNILVGSAPVALLQLQGLPPPLQN